MKWTLTLLLFILLAGCNIVGTKGYLTDAYTLRFSPRSIQQGQTFSVDLIGKKGVKNTQFVVKRSQFDYSTSCVKQATAPSDALARYECMLYDLGSYNFSMQILQISGEAAEAKASQNLNAYSNIFCAYVNQAALSTTYCNDPSRNIGPRKIYKNVPALFGIQVLAGSINSYFVKYRH